jgi:hypothetical protein
MSRSMFSTRVSDDVLAALRNYATERQITLGAAVDILLAKGLGLERKASIDPDPAADIEADEPLLVPDNVEIHNHIFSPPEGFMPIEASPPMSEEPIPDQQQPLVDAAVQRCLWGVYASESELVTRHPDWVLADPQNLRRRFLALVAEVEKLGIERASPIALEFLGARMDGLTLEAARSVLEQSGPFRPATK